MIQYLNELTILKMVEKYFKKSKTTYNNTTEKKSSKTTKKIKIIRINL